MERAQSHDPSERLKIRLGRLARGDRKDPAGELETREPEELMDLEAFETAAPDESSTGGPR